jgi:hypothetical protein
MANTIGYGQGAVNNTNGFGKAPTNNTIDFGEVCADSWSPETNLTGTASTPSFSNTQSIQLDGIDDYVEVSDADNLSFGNGTTDSPFSLSAWVKISNFNNAHIIFEKRDHANNNNYEYVLAITSAGGINNNIYDYNSLNRRGRKTSDGLISLNTWYHIAMTYSGVGGTNASDGIKTYLNGVRVDNANNQKNTYTAMHNTNQPFKIGRILAGNIDEASVFDVELSASDVTNIYNSGLPNDISSISGLVSWWRFEGTGTTATDSGSGGNNGTLTNGVTRSSDVPT